MDRNQRAISSMASAAWELRNHLLRCHHNKRRTGFGKPSLSQLDWTTSGLNLLHPLHCLGSDGYDFHSEQRSDEDAAVQPYQVTLSYGNASCSENYYPPPSIAPGSGYALTWTYSSGYPCPNTQATSGEAFSGNVMFSYGLNGTFELLFTGAFQP